VISDEALNGFDRTDGAMPARDLIEVSLDFNEFVRLNSTTLLRRAFLLTADRHLAEDLLQTTLAKVALRWSSVVSKGDPMPYVRTALVRTAIGWRRRRWSGEIPSGTLPEDGRGDLADVVDGREHMRQALRAVPVRQRAVLVLRFFDDLTEAQTAQALGCSIGTVKSQTAKGLARLRGVLTAQNPTPESTTIHESRGPR